MSKYQIGDRVRILSFCGLTKGVTGITGTVTESDFDMFEGASVLLDRPFVQYVFGVPHPVPDATFMDYEMEYEDNRKDAAVGDLLASVGDILVTETMKSCQTERKQWMIWNTYFKGDREVSVICPDCYDKVKVPESDIANICYWNREPSEPLTMTYSNVGTNGI